METDVFPDVGYRARQIARFERDLRSWLQTAEGRFALYCAERERDTAEEERAAVGRPREHDGR